MAMCPSNANMVEDADTYKIRNDEIFYIYI